MKPDFNENHELAFGDKKADWCCKCGTFAEHCGGTQCTPVEEAKRWWPQGPKKEQSK